MADDHVVAGVDAGGSHTVAVLVDTDGRERARREGPGSAVGPGAEAVSAEIVSRLVQDAVGRAGGPAVAALVVGAAGVGHAPAREAFVNALRARGAPARTMVVTDAEAAFASAFGDGAGILLLSGTGSIALARDPSGAWHRVGGWGWRSGDEGSGYAIGRAGVAAVGRALDGRGPATTLSQLLPAALGIADAPALLAWARDAAPAGLAGLGTAVQTAARRGDPVAADIVAGAARDLAAHLRPLHSRFPGPAPVPVVLAGGALRPGAALRTAVHDVAAGLPFVEICDRSVDAAHGAAWLALRLLRGLAG
jgi:glucosamine kinase